MTTTATKTSETEGDITVAFRVPKKVRDFYESIAAKERRKLSQVLRFVVEEHYAKNKRKAA
jgi:hypothetical protein